MTFQEAERALTGFLAEKRYYVDIVREAWTEISGITLKPSGSVTALIVSEKYFEVCVKIGAPHLVSEYQILVRT